MNDMPLSPLQRAALVIEKMQAKLDALEHAKNEPIAIIGLSCRFPGNADDVQAFWRLLHDGVDAITDVPPVRWNSDDLKIDTKSGGFLQQIDLFDPQFFGISPREAVSMDPQHRLLLEVSWEALENAGQTRERLAGSRSGVFVGITLNEYSRQFDLSDSLDVYYITGNVLNAAAGRISYTLGLQGPSMAIDTACSSSLVAVHQACQSLRNGDCDLALTGGVNLILSPITMFALFQADMLAADGRCKTFDAAADGLGRGEGCGIIVLKRFSDARADGDNILALIRGSAVNQDGASSGLTVPNGVAQQHLIHQALENAKVAPSEVDYVEAHGTGTALGDPIEVGALASVLGEGRLPSQPVMLGSVKTNVGHLESASGVTGLIKVVLALQHEEIPPHLHFKQPNPHIPWNELPVKVLTEATPWPSGEKRRIAGVSSFGITGTNAHVVLEEAPKTDQASANSVERPLHLLTLSAKTAAALKQLAARYEKHLAAHPTLAWADICFSANTGRSHFNHRLGVVASSVAQAREKLTAFIEGQTAISGVTVTPQRHKIAFLFTGQGSQYIDMGRQLYETQPTFRQTLERCDEILRPYLEKPLLSVISDQVINETAYTQPALFALEYALAKLWQSWGIEPDVVMGHSVGEYVAACIAGVFSLEDGLKLIAARGHLMQTLCDKGDMLVLSVDETKAAEIIQPYAQDVSIAAINGPENVVISGKHEAIESIRAALSTEKDLKTKLLPVSHAFHSPMMEPMLAEFERVATEITYATPQIPLCSNITGQLATEEIATPAYWCRHVRKPVRFAASMETLYQQGYEIFVEIGPKPSLLSMARQCLPEGTWLVSLRQGQEDWQPLLQSLGELYVRGVPVDWSGFEKDYPRRKVALPNYPFQRQAYWIETADLRAVQKPKSKKKGHLLLGQKLYSAPLKGQEIIFESQLQPSHPAFLAHYRVFKTTLFPAAAYLEMALAAGRAILKSDHLILENVVIQQTLILPEDEVKTVQLILTPEDSSKINFGLLAYSFKIFSLKNDDWTCHASGKVMEGQPEASSVDLAALQARCTEEIAVTDYYQQAREKRGIDFGPSFQAIQKLWRHDGEAIGQIQLPKSLVLEATDFYLHPVLLDATFQVLGAIFPDDGKTYILVSIERLHVYRKPDFRLWSVAMRRPVKDSQFFMADLRLFAEDGQLIASIEALKLQKVNRQSLFALTQESLPDWLYEIEWQPQVRLGLPPDYMPPPTEISTRLKPYMESSIAQIEFYGKLLPQLDALSVEYILSAFQQMGWKLNQRFSSTTITEQLGVVSQHQRLLGRLLEILREEGILRHRGDEWEVSGVPALKKPAEHVNTLLAQYPTSNAQLTLLARCGAELAEVLRGECDPLQLLFPDGDLTTTTQLYQDSPFAQVMNTYIQKAVLQALERLPQGRGVRVLEIGAGTGGTTAYLLPQLPAHRTEYVFTDISPLFTTQAQKKFNDYPFVRYQVLDIEKAPESQGFDKHQYDLVVAANVLHATKDLGETLQHIHSLLAPGGMLLLWEVTERQHWLDLTFGLTKGWWRFADRHLRPDYPLLSGEQWQALLQKNGFIQATTISPTFQTLQQAVIVAQTASSPQRDEVQKAEGTWLIFADSQGIGQQLAALVQAKGDIVILVFPGKTYEQIVEQTFRINLVNPADFQRLLVEAVEATHRPLTHVLHLWSLDTDTLTITDTAQSNACRSTLYLIQTLVKKEFYKPPVLWLVTQGAVPAPNSNSPNSQIPIPNLAQSPLWGMGKVIALEHPELNCVRVDLDPEGDVGAQALFEEIGSKTSEEQIAFRDNARYVARLMRYSQPLHQEERFNKSLFQTDSTYLITGGLSGLGLLVAGWMVEQGAKYLVLIGRRGANQTVKSQLKALEQTGAKVVVAQADVSIATQIARVLADIEQTLPPLRGIIHSAGVLDDGVLSSQNWERFEKVMAPKVQGAWNLHSLTQHNSLDFFVLFSSAASLLGSIAQANHAAANSFLDALAYYRRAQGLPCMSINWGPWSEIGAAAERKLDEQMHKKGLWSIAPQQGLQILEQLFSKKTPTQVGVIPINWSQFITQRGGASLFFSHQVELPKKEQQIYFKNQIKSMRADERRAYLTAQVQSQVAKVLGMQASKPIAPQQGFFDLGMDSLTLVELRNRLQVILDCPLPSTLAFKHPTLETLVNFLEHEILGTMPVTGAEITSPQEVDDELETP
jgi:malonyl CoA-acyl carrier protein transacylase